eukprot:331348_1
MTGVRDYNNLSSKSNIKTTSKMKRINNNQKYLHHKDDKSSSSSTACSELDDIEGSMSEEIKMIKRYIDNTKHNYGFKQHLTNLATGNDLMMNDVVEDINNPDLTGTPDGTPELFDNDDLIQISNIKKPQYISLPKPPPHQFPKHLQFTPTQHKPKTQHTKKQNRRAHVLTQVT